MDSPEFWFEKAKKAEEFLETLKEPEPRRMVEGLILLYKRIGWYMQIMKTTTVK